METMKEIEFVENGTTIITEFAEDMHEVGKLIRMRKDGLLAGRDITIYIDGEEHKQAAFMTDVKRVAKHMKLDWMENKIMGDLHI